MRKLVENITHALMSDPTWREEAWQQVSEAAGLDENGGILPPPDGFKIDQSPVTWWRNATAKE